MDISKRELEEIMAKQAKEVAVGSDERMQRYIGGLKEDFDHKLGAVLEFVKDVPRIKQKLDATFDKVGEIAVDVEVIKEAAKDHERRLQRLEVR